MPDAGVSPDAAPERRAWPPSLRSHFLRASRRDERCGGLLDVAVVGEGDRLLVIGDSGTDLLCEAARRGCRGGSAFRVAPLHPDPVEVVIAPAVQTEEAGRAVTDCARRALPAGGRLALRLIGQGVAGGAMALATALVTRLRDAGFERVRLRGQVGENLVVVGTLSRGRRAVRTA